MPTSARRAAPSPNLVGRHAHMPPWPGCVDCEPGNSGSPVWRGVGTPPYGPDRKRGVGAAISRPDRAAVPIAPPLNAVGRHAHMPPWPGCVDCEPGNSGGPVWRGVGTPPYGPDRKRGVGAAISRPDRAAMTEGPMIPAVRHGRLIAAHTSRPMPLYFTAKIPIPWSGRGFSIIAPACGRRRPGPRGCCTGSCGTGPP